MRWSETPESSGAPLLRPRAAEGEEWLEAARLADEVFTAESGRTHHMASMFPLLFSPANRQHLRVIEAPREGVVSHVGIRVVDVSLFGHRIPLGCIGSVVTRAGWRGRGLASALIEDAFARLRDEGVPAAWISGGRGLYLRHGCRQVGAVRVFKVPPGEAPGPPLTPLPLPAPGSPEDAAALLAAPAFRALVDLYHQEPVRLVRSIDVFASELCAAGLARAMGHSQHVYLAGEPPTAAWVVAAPPAALRGQQAARVLEATGSRAVLAASAPAVAAASGAGLALFVMAWDAELLVRCRAAGWEEKMEPLYGTFRVLDGARLSRILAPYVAERLGSGSASSLDGVTWPGSDPADPSGAPETWVWGAPGPGVPPAGSPLPAPAFPLPWPWPAGLDYV